MNADLSLERPKEEHVDAGLRDEEVVFKTERRGRLHDRVFKFSTHGVKL